MQRTLDQLQILVEETPQTGQVSKASSPTQVEFESHLCKGLDDLPLTLIDESKLNLRSSGIVGSPPASMSISSNSVLSPSRRNSVPVTARANSVLPSSVCVLTSAPLAISTCAARA
jgi:hypothetical protein